jgi:hypothetical protein
VRLVLPPTAGELLVSVDGELAWPAQVDLTDRWNGWLSPQFRPSVARTLARWQTDWVARLELERDDFEQDQLILSPDGRTLVHLVWDEDGEAYARPDPFYGPPTLLGTREHAVWLVYDLTDPSGRVAIGAWHWCWFQVQPTDLAQP